MNELAQMNAPKMSGQRMNGVWTSGRVWKRGAMLNNGIESEQVRGGKTMCGDLTGFLRAGLSAMGNWRTDSGEYG